MLRIIGIDPGSRITGYGIIEIKGSMQQCIAFGQIRTKEADTADRLYQIFSELSTIIQEHRPTEAAIEQVFMAKNAQSALKLGQARGTALVALAQGGLSVAEYSARAIKQGIVGYGGANKEQVQHMVCSLLQLKQKVPADAADALAIALCHANCRLVNERLKNAKTTAGEGS